MLFVQESGMLVASTSWRRLRTVSFAASRQEPALLTSWFQSLKTQFRLLTSNIAEEYVYVKPLNSATMGK
jgi:hypothetical protein